MSDAHTVKTLAQAAQELGVKVSSLRTEIRKGHLHPIVIAGRFYVTDDIIQEMLATCRAKPKDLGSISEATELEAAPGSSSTARSSVALEAARMTLQELKERSRATSRANTRRQLEAQINSTES